MATLKTFDKKDYPVLLASTVLDASKGTLFGASGLKPDKTNRTILVGLGGTGVRTINYVKGALEKRLDPTWSQYVGFLGVDTSWSEFKGATYLGVDEQLVVTRNGVDQRMSNPASYPTAVRRFMLKGAQLPALSSDGAGQTRLIGKIKIHDQESGSIGVDEDIVNRLETLVKKLSPLPVGTPGTYQVYVIGSVCGGTCSGGITEMPALIRKAIPDRVKVNAMLYLPDTLMGLDPGSAHRMQANGYATLKEINYFMGMYMRPGYSEVWSYNDRAKMELDYRSSATGEGFIDMPYLIGSTSGSAADASKTAMETIAEFLISILAEVTSPDGALFLTSAFESNAITKRGTKDPAAGSVYGEASGSFHEFPKRYAAIGFAEASAPQKLVRAYTVGKACKEAGMKSVTPEERISLAASGNVGLLPFRGEDDLLNATDGTAKAAELLKPIANILAIVHNASFGLQTDLNQNDITWIRVKNGDFDTPAFANMVETKIQNMTSPQTMNELRAYIRDAFVQFRQGVHAYVRDEGPLAFANLYAGRFSKVGENYGIGIGEMLQNLVNGKGMRGESFGWLSVEDAQRAFATACDTIKQADVSLVLNRIFSTESPKQTSQKDAWILAYNNLCKAKINQKRREIALGEHGALREDFMMPAAHLADDVKAFGYLIESLVGIYQNHGSKMEKFEDFRTAQDHKTEVNLAAVDSTSYEWLKGQADRSLATVNAKQLRDSLVNSFFDRGEDGTPNSQKWLDIPENTVTTTPGTNQIKLAVDDVPIPAREMFDKCVSGSVTTTLDVSIESMFTMLKSAGKSYDVIADDIIAELHNRSQVQIRGNIPNECLQCYIMYPSSLTTGSGEGPAIAAAIKNAANKRFGGKIQTYASDNADSIMFYQLATPFEIYCLSSLAEWEDQYEQGQFGITAVNAYLHGLSPDLTEKVIPGQPSEFVQTMPWTEYPAIAPTATDPRLPDPKTGKISHEGILRQRLDAQIAEARKLGVLFSEQDAAGNWIVKRVHCDKSTNWQFDALQCESDPFTGLLPLGKALAEAVAAQNGKSLAEEPFCRRVMLTEAGCMTMAQPTEEMAWQYAARVLRAHVPMAIEVRETTKIFAEWAKAIIEFNAKLLAKLQPAKMIHMIRGDILSKAEGGIWSYIQANGQKKILSRLTPDMVGFLQPKERFMVENGLLCYFLYTKLKSVLNTTDLFDEAFNRAKNNRDHMMNSGDTERMTRCDELVSALETETAALLEKGARATEDLIGDVAPKSALVSALSPLDSATIKDIELFYARAQLWQRI